MAENKYKVFAWRSRLLGTIKYLGIDPWDKVDWAPMRLAKLIQDTSAEDWAAWLRKFPGADSVYLASLTDGSDADLKDEMFTPRPRPRPELVPDDEVDVEVDVEPVVVDPDDEDVVEIVRKKRTR